MELEELTTLTSDYATKLQFWKQYHTGAKKKKYIDQWKKIGSPEKNSYTYEHHFIFLPPLTKEARI